MELSRITGVSPREVWPNEASDFTPWLAANIGVLGDALGLDIEVTTTEASVGAFSLDILGTVPGSDRVVIVENQLERTDHGHLGQLLAYAAGLDAGIVIWVSPEVRDEHRQTVQWLNERTTDAVAFFAVQVEVWSIDGSRPAPRFSVIAHPSEFQRTLAREARTPTRTGAAYREFYLGLLQALHSEHPGFTTIVPANVSYRGWLNVATAGVGVIVGCAFDAESFRVQAYINQPDRAMNKEIFDRLQVASGEIEAAIGEDLEWLRLDDRNPCRVLARRDGGISSPESVLAQHRQWAADILPRFRDVFGPRIQAMDFDAPAVAEVGALE